MAQRNCGTRKTTAQQIANISNDENVTLVAKGAKGVVAVAKKAFKTGDFILRMSHPKVYRTLREAIIGALAAYPFLYGLYLDAQKGLCWQTEVFYDLFIKVEGSEGDLWFFDASLDDTKSNWKPVFFYLNSCAWGIPIEQWCQRTRLMEGENTKIVYYFVDKARAAGEEIVRYRALLWKATKDIQPGDDLLWRYECPEATAPTFSFSGRHTEAPSAAANCLDITLGSNRINTNLICQICGKSLVKLPFCWTNGKRNRSPPGIKIYQCPKHGYGCNLQFDYGNGEE